MIEVAEICRKYEQEFRSKYKLSPSMNKAFNAIISCRTAKLGGHLYVCDECGHTKISYNSCRDRHCPKCQALAKEKWVEERNKDLLPIQYFHVTFTIPAQLNPLVLQNQKELYSLLFKTSSDTLFKLTKDKKHLGAQIGITSVLHTWGQNLMSHPHVHCIVTGGGLSFDEKKWCPTRKKFFLPVKAISDVFKNKFLYHLKKKYKKGLLEFHGSLESLKSPNNFSKFKDELFNKKWVVSSLPSINSGGNVLTYLGRYVNSVAISNHRIIKFEEGKVTFKWKDYSDHNKIKLMTLEAVEFIRRFLLHILPNRFVKIRHYGLLSNKNKKTKLEICRKLLNVDDQPSETTTEKETWQELMFRLTGKDVNKCPCCEKGKMIIKSEILPSKVVA